MQFSFPLHQWPLWTALAVLILAVCAVLLYMLEKRRGARLNRFVESGLAAQLMPGWSPERRRPLAWIFLLGILFVLLAAAGPRWGKKWAPVTRVSRDVLVVLDVSLSMDAENPPPTRLVRARQKIESLLERSPADRFGLVAFSGEAATLCPLTLDHGYFRSVLDAINTNTLSTDGSDISAALKEALDVFQEDAQRFGEDNSGDRVVLLLSDGEETAGDALALAEQIGRYARIYVIGIGDPQGAVVTYPAWLRQYVRIPEDKLTRLSKLDEENLSRIAVQSGGAYVRITPDNSDVDFIQQELKQLRSRVTAGEVRFQMTERYQWPLILAWFFFFLEGVWMLMLAPMRKRRMRLEAQNHG
ncbi:MAG TPA: VWA domain-containing protein [Candidatus Hydrogenedentes bacterium]|jgi:Ca-activated chloride channel family protein|nr:VWA domain-containing protein [Candidatus Hydrogenedentota bacterium]